MTRHAFGLPSPAGVVALGALAAACTGVVDAGEDGGSGGPSGSGSTTGNPPPGTQIPLTEDPGRKDMHRLNTTEYNATVRDVLGTTLQPATANWRGGEIAGFDNIATQLGVDDQQYERYLNAANDLAEEFFGNPALKSRYVTCETTDDVACVQGIINAAGLHIFRRPLKTEEVDTYFRAYQGARALGDDHDASLKVVLRALLSSAEFLYRIEVDPDPTSNVPHPLTPYELASRLSYFLWSSAPDDALLAAAGDGSIASDAALEAAVERMLADARSARLIENFAGQWLGGRKAAEHAADGVLYPMWTAEMGAAAANEIYVFFGDFLLGSRSWMDFLKADFNYVQPALAPLYGIPAPPAGMERMELTTDQRFGFMGLGGFLAMSSRAERTSPTLRGKWVLLNLLCVKIDPPATAVPQLTDTDPNVANLSVREKLTQHRENPACAGCHAIIDPYGLALENFDGIGKWRDAYPDGTVIDASTVSADGVSFTGLAGLTDTVTADPRFTSCVGEKLLTYGLGRTMGDTDKPYLEAVHDAWVQESPPTLRSLIGSLVLTDPFRQRRGETAQ